MDVYKTDTELNEVAIREDILQKITSKEAIRWFTDVQLWRSKRNSMS